jgi:hypothetical protein
VFSELDSDQFLLWNIDFLTADEFSAELASGNAFVAGQDEEGRPVVVINHLGDL